MTRIPPSTPKEDTSLPNYLPAYQHVENDLRRKVNDAVWGPGAMLPNRDELAQQYKVARGTVQRAIRNLIADGTLRTDHRRGTFVASNAAPIRAPEAKTRAATRQMIALITQLGTHAEGYPHMNYPPILAIMQGINRTLQQRDAPFRLVTFNTRSGNWEQGRAQDVELERQALESLEVENFPGAILWHIGGQQTLPQLRHLVERGFPLVFLDRCPEELLGDCVGVGNYVGAREAVEYLLSLGHTRIAHLTTEENIQPIKGRLEGYRDALLEQGIAFDPTLVRAVPEYADRNTIPAIVDYFFDLPDPPTACFVVNDGFANNLIQALEKKAHAVPQAMSVIGFDDLEQYLPHPGRLTTMRQPFELIGRRAADLLLRRLNTPEGAPQQTHSVELPTRLIVRQTCRAFQP